MTGLSPVTASRQKRILLAVICLHLCQFRLSAHSALGLCLFESCSKCLLVNIFCSPGGLRKYYSVYGCRKIRWSPYALRRSTMQTFYSLRPPILQWNQVPCWKTVSSLKEISQEGTARRWIPQRRCCLKSTSSNRLIIWWLEMLAAMGLLRVAGELM